MDCKLHAAKCTLRCKSYFCPSILGGITTIAYHINGTSADKAELNINQSRANELAAQGWLISDSPIVWAEKQYIGGELVDIPKPAEPEPPTEAELLAQAKQSKLWQIESKLAEMDRYLPRALEDFWTAIGFDATTLPQVQQDRLAQKAALRAAYTAVGAAGTIDAGNHEYFRQIGVHPLTAQVDLAIYFTNLNKQIEEGQAPDITSFNQFLCDMAKRHKGCSQKMIEAKGMLSGAFDKAMYQSDKG